MDTKRRISILGGGMGALTAAYQLTHPRNPKSAEFGVTVYQMGWRLGGKGASGRNLDPRYYGRIEEHGLHCLFGFYDNTFRLLRDCYAELGRPPGTPLSSWREAVTPENSAVFVEQVNGERLNWRIVNPVTPFEPGEGSATLPLWDTIVLVLEYLEWNIFRGGDEDDPPLPGDGRKPKRALLATAAALHAAARVVLGAATASDQVLKRVDRKAPGARRALLRAAQDRAASTLEMFRTAAWTAYRGSVLRSHGRRRQWLLLNFVTSIAIGALKDGVFDEGLDVINDYDFRQWIERHTFDDGGLMLDSVLMRVVYDSSFAYEDGDTRIRQHESHAGRANFEAGTLLRGLLRASFTYKGAFGWKMNGGTGDVMIAPLYLVLLRRVVCFRFFHEVLSLHVSSDRRAVDRISLGLQATVKDGEYKPLIDIDGLPSWPSTPLFDQLHEGDELRSHGIDLESPRSGWRSRERIELHRGRDFDDVVLGISLGALPYLCKELIETSPKWKRTVQNVKTTRTQALQLWLTPATRDLGWSGKGQPVTSFWYSEESPLNVWADMSHLIPYEGSTRTRPGHVSYFVSPMRDEAPLTPTDHGHVDVEAGLDVARARARVLESARSLLDEHVCKILFPDGMAHGREGGNFNWETLAAEESNLYGAARLETQYFRANIAPSDRYVLSVAGSTKHRLHAHDPTEFANLYLAGDWIRNGLNCRAMESAVLGGLLAAAALSGFPRHKDIVGLGPIDC